MTMFFHRNPIITTFLLFTSYCCFLVLVCLVFLSLFSPLEVGVLLNPSIEEAKTAEILLPKEHLAVNSKAVFDIGTPFWGGFFFFCMLFFKVGLKFFLMLFSDPNDQFVSEMIQTIVQEIQEADLKAPSELEKTPTLSVPIQVGQVVIPLVLLLYTLFKP